MFAMFLSVVLTSSCRASANIQISGAWYVCKKHNDLNVDGDENGNERLKGKRPKPFW